MPYPKSAANYALNGGFFAGSGADISEVGEHGTVITIREAQARERIDLNGKKPYHL